MTYKPAAQDGAAACATAPPSTTRMNVPMPVVAAVTVDASLGDPVMVTQFAYSGGTWSPVERTLAGFGGGTETEVEDAYTPTLVATSSFDVGIVNRQIRGAELRHRTADASGYVFSRSTATWTTVDIATGIDGRTVRCLRAEDLMGN